MKEDNEFHEKGNNVQKFASDSANFPNFYFLNYFGDF